MYKIPNTDLIAMDESEYLEHFGVSGMKWGHRKALQPSLRKMRGIGRVGSTKNATVKQRAAYKQASADYYNKKRKLKGKDAVDDKTAAYRQDIKNDAVKGAKYLAGSYVLHKSARSLAMVFQLTRQASPFISTLSGMSAIALQGASIGTGVAGGVSVARAGVKRIKGGKNGDRG